MPSAARSRWVGSLLVIGLLAGLVAAAAGAWRPGLLTVGGLLLLTTALRLWLPEVRLGTLAVRSRWLDVGFLVVAASVLIAAGLSLP